jgi:hypothetical protein
VNRISGWTKAIPLTRVFRDDENARLTWWAVLALLALSVVGGLLRTGFSATLDSVWAEDGRDFLATSLSDGAIGSLLEPFAGYGHVLPRILTGIATAAPLSAASAIMAFEAVTAVGLLAVVVYRASAGHVQNVWIRFLLAAFVALQPVAREVLVSLANLQWYLIFAAFVVLLWSANSRSAIIVGGIVCFLAAASSPFGILLLPYAVLRIVGLRTGRGWVAPLALASGSVVQTWVMLHAPERDLDPMTWPLRLGAWYLGHVLAPVFFGERLTGDDLTARSLGLGVVALAVGVLLWFAASRRARSDMLPVLVCVGVFSILFYLAPTVVGGIAPPRYAVTAALSLAFGVAVMASQVVGDRREASPSVRARLPLVVGIGTVMLVCWAVSLPAGRPAGPSWRQAVQSGSSACKSGSAQSVEVAISPARWTARLPCSKVNVSTNG